MPKCVSSQLTVQSIVVDIGLEGTCGLDFGAAVLMKVRKATCNYLDNNQYPPIIGDMTS